MAPDLPRLLAGNHQASRNQRGVAGRTGRPRASRSDPGGCKLSEYARHLHLRDLLLNANSLAVLRPLRRRGKPPSRGSDWRRCARAGGGRSLRCLGSSNARHHASVAAVAALAAPVGSDRVASQRCPPSEAPERPQPTNSGGSPVTNRRAPSRTVGRSTSASRAAEGLGERRQPGPPDAERLGENLSPRRRIHERQARAYRTITRGCSSRSSPCTPPRPGGAPGGGYSPEVPHLTSDHAPPPARSFRAPSARSEPSRARQVVAVRSRACLAPATAAAVACALAAWPRRPLWPHCARDKVGPQCCRSCAPREQR